jgi:hypothetical protein
MRAYANLGFPKRRILEIINAIDCPYKDIKMV